MFGRQIIMLRSKLRPVNIHILVLFCSQYVNVVLNSGYSNHV